MSDQLKVHDRRLFNSDGELRDEFRHLEDAKAPDPNASHELQPEAAANAAPETPSHPPIPDDVEGYEPDSGGQKPSLMDLIGLLAEPASLYLRQAGMARSGDLKAASELDQNLQLAGLHIDLLSVLREKSVGALEAQERHMLDDVISRLQTGYVQIKGS